VTAGIVRAAAVGLLAEVLLVIGQQSSNPFIFAGQVAASAFLAGVLAFGVRHRRDRARPPRADEAAPAEGGPS
jgi:hypothetical protein